MEGGREGHGNHLSEEFQDESGLELSLGLGLSSADSRQKWKAPEGPAACSTPSVDPTGEPSAGNGMHPYGKPKASSKASGLDAALKKFLEGRLDEQDESSKLIDASNSFNLQKEMEKPTALGSQERSGQQLEVGLDTDNRGKPFLFKELQVSGQATSRGQSPTHTSPLLGDALKIAPLGSNSSSPSSAEGLGHFDGDDATQETSEQHKKFQEARKKRKHLNEEHKHQKKGKKEDKPGTHGFRRPGSNTWVSASALDMDNSLLGLRGNDTGEQVEQETSQESRDGLKGSDTESAGFDKNAIGDMGPNDIRGTGDDSKGVEVNFMPRLQAVDTDKKGLTQAENNEWNLTMQSRATAPIMQSQVREVSMKGLSCLPNKQKDGSVLAIGREGDKAGSPLQRLIEKVPSETSSASTDGTEKLEEKGRSGISEASSSAPEVMGSDKAIPVSPAGPFFPPGVTTTTSALPYPVPPYPVVPMSYSLPGSMPPAPGMPFPVGLNFPYVMQYLPPDGSEQNPMRPVSSSSFQPLVGVDFPPPQLSSSEGAPWMQALRPPVGAPFTNASNGALYSRNAIGIVEDANNRLQGARVVRDNGSGNASGDTSSLQNHTLFRAVTHNSTHDSQLYQGPDALPHPSLPIPAVPHFSSQLAMPDHGEVRTVKEQGSSTIFPGFVAQGLPGGSARPPSSSGVKENGGQDQAKFAGKVEHAHHRNMAEPSSLGQEEFRRVIGGQFHQGSTENLSVGEGLGEDMALLQRGIPPGLKFGGSGTPPDLPWVYTMGPNGRAVGGALYRLSRTQLRVVCACHGKHLSPAEFTQHAGGLDTTNAEKDAVISSSPLTSQAS